MHFTSEQDWGREHLQYNMMFTSSGSSLGSLIVGSSSFIQSGLQAVSKKGQCSHRIFSCMKSSTSSWPTSNVIVRGLAL